MYGLKALSYMVIRGIKRSNKNPAVAFLVLNIGQMRIPDNIKIPPISKMMFLFPMKEMRKNPAMNVPMIAPKVEKAYIFPIIPPAFSKP